MRLPSISPTVSTDVVFDPPLFGLTMLGSSHGFDPGGSTTGFVVWCGGRGLLVDPPIYSSAILRQKGIPHRLLEGIILTHVHADHDGGCFQMLLEEKRLMLITTPTIFNSFLRKFCALSGYHADFLRQLMVYQPVVIGEPFQFMGAAFVFHYSLHTIPTVGFQAFYAGRSIAFSGDHLNHPDTFQCLFDKGIVTKERRDFLMNFPWNADVVLHEAGVPPVHTPLSVFLDLPEDVKRRLYLCHCSPKQVSRDSGLRVATEGVENTIRVAVEPPPHATAVQILDLFERIDIFRGFYIDRAREILQFVQEETFHAGDTIIREGDAGIRFRVIVSGVVGIRAPGDAEAESKFYSTGDFFGETSLITGGPTTATVHAVTEVACISFDRNQFLHLLRGTNAVEQLLHLAAIRRDPSWEVLESNSCFKRLSSSQRTSFQTILHTKCVSKNDILWEQGTAPAEVGILVSEGLMELHRFPASHASITEEETTQPSSAKRMRHEESPIFRRGAFLCDVNAMLQGSPPSTTCIAHTDGVVFEIRRDDFRRFLEENPKITLLLMNTRFVD